MSDPRVFCRIKLPAEKSGSVRFELMVNGLKVAELSVSEYADMLAQFSSSVRWIDPKLR